MIVYNDITKHYYMPYTVAEASQGTFMDLYKKIAQEANRPDDKMDCCHIDVSTDIQEAWLNSVPECEKGSMAMAICFAGPKANKDLPKETIRYDEKFFIPSSEDA